MALTDEIAIKLGIQTGDLKAALADANASIKTFGQKGANDANSFFTQVSKKMTDMKALGTAVGTALGLNLQSIAENLARFVTGISKQEEEAFQKLDQVSTQVADAAIKNMRANLTEEQKYQLALTERDRLLKQIAETTGTTGEAQLKAAEKNLELQQQLSIIGDYERKQNEAHEKQENDFLKDRIAQNEDIYEKEVDSMALNERIASLKGTIAATERMLADATIDAVAKEGFSNNLIAQRKLLLDAELDLRKKTTLSEDESHEYLLLQAKQIAGIITPAERERFQLLQLQTKELKVQAQIEEILAIPPEERTQAEKDRLKALILQDSELQKQIADTQALITGSDQLADAAAKVTDQLTQQVKLKERLVYLGQSDASANQQLTDAQLQEKIANLNQEIFNLQAQSTPGNQYTTDLLLSRTRGLLYQAQDEANTRTFFRADVAAVGEKAALGSVSAFDQDRYQFYLTQQVDLAKDNNQTQNAILSNLQKLLGPSAVAKGQT